MEVIKGITEEQRQQHADTIFTYKDNQNSYSDIDAASVSQSHTNNDQSMISKSMIEDENDSDDGIGLDNVQNEANHEAVNNGVIAING